ncbi:MAG TPA: glycoside hydrolase family 2 TIM barrel-domain containing protein [Solirubrobacteraceae bacterium]
MRSPLRHLLAVACLLAALPAAAAAPAQAATSSLPTGRPATTDGPAGRLGLDGRWLFRLDPADTGLDERLFAQKSTAGWAPVSIPHAWNANDDSDASMIGTVGWYRRDFRLPRMAGKPTWLIRFLAVNHRMEVWLNGRQIGAHSGPYLPYEIALRGVRLKRVNRLVVRVGNRRRAVDFPPGAGLGGGWWNYGGIIREVEVRPVFGVDVADVRALPVLKTPRSPARVRIRAVLRNHDDEDRRVSVQGTLGGIPFRLGGHQVEAGKKVVAAKTVLVRRPHLWSPGDPFLYPLTVEAVSERGTARRSLHVGIRSIAVVDGRLELNGRPTRIHGVGFHEDVPGRGSALLPNDRRRLVARAGRVGATMLRTHYPMHPHLLELADKLGFLVWSEVPVWRMKPRTLGRPGVVNRAIALSRENAEVNASHPSIFTWSLGNELATQPTAVEADYYARGAAAVREVDPTRPISVALQTRQPFTCFAAAYAPIDLLGVNEYFGWYSGSNDDLSPYLDAMRACHPGQAIMITEFGAEANRSGPYEEKGTYEFQHEWIGRHLGVFATKPWLSGVSYWALNEFKVRPGWAGGNPRPEPPYHRKGLLSYDGRPKPAYVLIRQAFGGPRARVRTRGR